MDELNQLRELRNQFDQLSSEDYESKSLSEINEYIDKLIELQKSVDGLNEQASKQYISGEYDVDALHTFSSEYPELSDNIYNATINASTFKNQMLTRMRNDFINQRELNLEIERKNREIDSNNSRIEEIKNDLDYNLRFLENLNSVLDDMNKNNNLNQDALNSINNKIREVQRTIDDLNYELSNLLQRNEALNREISDIQVTERKDEKDNIINNHSTKNDSQTVEPNYTSTESAGNSSDNFVDNDQKNMLDNAQRVTIDGIDYAILLNSEETYKNYSSQGFAKNAFGWYFNPWIDDYDETYDPINDTEFMRYDYYKIVRTVDVDKTLEKYKSEGFSKNAFGWYFNPWIDDYDESYAPINDPEFQVFIDNYIFDFDRQKNPKFEKEQEVKEPEKNEPTDKKPEEEQEKDPEIIDTIVNDTPRVHNPEIPVHKVDYERAKESARERNFDAFKKYFGDKEMQEEYKLRINRIHSHIIEKNSYSTVEDYPEIYEDFKTCNVLEYKDTLERYTQGRDAYIKIYNDLSSNDMLPVDENGNIIDLESFIQTYALMDREYIETNNQSYDKHKTTRMNLGTLGKYGEKRAYQSWQKIIGFDGDVNLKNALIDLFVTANNLQTFLFHNIKSPLYKGLGTHVFVPIHKLIYKDKIATPYDNDRTHRYEARKDLKEQEYAQKITEWAEKKNIEREENGKRKLSPAVTSTMIGMGKLVGARVSAIFQYKKGNHAVISSGMKDNIKNAVEEEYERTDRLNKIERLQHEKAEQISKISQLAKEIRNTDDPIKKQVLFVEKVNCDQKIASIDRLIKYESRLQGEHQNDFVSLEVHEKANRENVTKTVTAVKAATRIALHKFVGPAIKQLIDKKTKEWVPGKDTRTTTYETTYDTEAIKNTTFNDVANSDTATYEASQTLFRDQDIKLDSDAITRGANIKFEINGETISFSGSDMAQGYQGVNRYVDLTTEGPLKIDGNTSVIDFMSYAATQSGHAEMTPDFIANYIAKAMSDSATPYEGFMSVFKDFDKWMVNNGRMNGIPDGWAQSLDGLYKTLDTMKKTTEIVSGEYDAGSWKENTELKELLMKGLGILCGANKVGAVMDTYELMRVTQSQRLMIEEALYKEESKKIIAKYPEGPEREEMLRKAKALCEQKAMEQAPIIAKQRKEYSIPTNEDYKNPNDMANIAISEWEEYKKSR